MYILLLNLKYFSMPIYLLVDLFKSKILFKSFKFKIKGILSY